MDLNCLKCKKNQCTWCRSNFNIRWQSMFSKCIASSAQILTFLPNAGQSHHRTLLHPPLQTQREEDHSAAGTAPADDWAGTNRDRFPHSGGILDCKLSTDHVGTVPVHQRTGVDLGPCLLVLHPRNRLPSGHFLLLLSQLPVVVSSFNFVPNHRGSCAGR